MRTLLSECYLWVTSSHSNQCLFFSTSKFREEWWLGWIQGQCQAVVFDADLLRLQLFLTRPCLFSSSGMCKYVGSNLLEIQFFKMKNIWHFTQFFKMFSFGSCHFSENWTRCCTSLLYGLWGPLSDDVPLMCQAWW